MRDSVPSASYSSVCNVLRQRNIPLIPTYRVYRLYDTYTSYIPYIRTWKPFYTNCKLQIMHLHIHVHFFERAHAYGTYVYVPNSSLDPIILRMRTFAASATQYSANLQLGTHRDSKGVSAETPLDLPPYSVSSTSIKNGCPC